MMQRIARRHNNVTVQWVPGHSDVDGNEEVDKHAKMAVEGGQKIL
jgi:ribonuclease HI